MGLTAIFGGTFNPFHIGHYEMLKALQNDDGIDEIWVLPDRIPPHKECDMLARDEDRIEMCEIVSSDFSKATVCLIEFEREGKSYTYDTVIELKEKYPEKQFVFVMGGDMLISFDRWYNWQELMKLLPFIAFKRVGTDIDKFNSCIRNLSEMGMQIKVKDELIPDASSTDFRKKNIKELLPQKVYEFIMERGIYNV